MSCYLDFHEFHWKRRCCRSWRLPVTVRLIFRKNDATRRPIVQPTDIDRWETEKKASSSLYLDELLIQKCKFRRRITVNCWPRKAFPEGFLPTWRMQQERHTCSETSYRITDVECIVRAQTLQVNLTGNGEWLGVRNSVEEFFLRPC